MRTVRGSFGNYLGDPVIEWTDIFSKKTLIYVRHEVAKKTPGKRP